MVVIVVMWTSFIHAFFKHHRHCTQGGGKSCIQKLGESQKPRRRNHQHVHHRDDDVATSTALMWRQELYHQQHVHHRNIFCAVGTAPNLATRTSVSGDQKARTHHDPLPHANADESVTAGKKMGTTSSSSRSDVCTTTETTSITTLAASTTAAADARGEKQKRLVLDPDASCADTRPTAVV